MTGSNDGFALHSAGIDIPGEEEDDEVVDADDDDGDDEGEEAEEDEEVQSPRRRLSIWPCITFCRLATRSSLLRMALHSRRSFFISTRSSSETALSSRPTDSLPPLSTAALRPLP